MIKELFNNNGTKTITGGAALIAVFSLLSRLLGIFRDRILASQFGAGDALDIYFTAFRVPDTIFNLIVLGAISAGFIPVFIECLQKHEKAVCWKLVNSVLNILIISLCVIALLFFVFAPFLIASWIAPGFSSEKLEMTIQLTRIMLLSPLLLGVSSIFGAILQSLRQFFIYSLAPILYNIGIIIGAVYLVPMMGIDGLAYGVVLGAFLHMIIQFFSARHFGFLYRLEMHGAREHVIKILRLTFPRILALAVTQVNLFVVTLFGSLLSIGSVAVFSLANNLQMFPIGIFAISFAIASFPSLSIAIARGDRELFLEHLLNTSRQVLFFILPSSALLIVLRAQIVRVVYGAGLFNWQNTIDTADALAIFAVSLFAQGLIPLLTRAFYALSDTKTPLFVSLVTVGGNIWLSATLIQAEWVLRYFSPVIGLVIAFSITQIAQCVALWILLRFKVKTLHEGAMLNSIFVISIATAALGLWTHVMKYAVEPWTGTTTFLGIFSQGLISGGVGILVFILVSLLLGSKEMRSVLQVLRQKHPTENMSGSAVRESFEETEQR